MTKQQVFDIQTLRDARQYLEGAYVPRKVDGVVCYIERLYTNREDNSLAGLRCLYTDGDDGHDRAIDLDEFDWEAVPTLGLVPEGTSLAYVSLDTARQWKKVITRNRLRRVAVPPLAGRGRYGGLALSQARFMFSPKYESIQSAREKIIKTTANACALSSELYVAAAGSKLFLGYKNNLVGMVDDDGVAHLHAKAAALRDIVADYMTVGGNL